MIGPHKGERPRDTLRIALALALFALCLPLEGYAQHRSERHASETPVEQEARVRHASGVALLRLTPPNATGALAELHRALELRQGGPLEYLEMIHIARSHQILQQYADAVRWYLDYLRVAPRSARAPTADEPSGPAVKESIRDMLRACALLHIDANVRAEVLDDHRPLGHTPIDVLVGTGERSIELRAPNHLAELRRIRIPARDRLSLRFDLQPVLTGGIHPAASLITGGVAAIAMLSGAGLWIGALVEEGSVEDDNQGRASVGQLVDARAYAVAGDVLMGAGLAIGVVAGILWARTDWSRLTTHRAPTAMVLPQAGGSTGFQLVGVF